MEAELALLPHCSSPKVSKSPRASRQFPLPTNVLMRLEITRRRHTVASATVNVASSAISADAAAVGVAPAVSPAAGGAADGVETDGLSPAAMTLSSSNWVMESGMEGVR